MTTYAEKLKDPRWQKKRLEILNRDSFTCRKCQSKEKTLHVHHVAYLKGNDPWDYHEYYFLTLCEDCHADEDDSAKDVIAALSRLNYFSSDFSNLWDLIALQPNIFTKILEMLRNE